MTFSDILGQKRTKDFLLRQHAGGRIPHAQLFLGHTGSGNLALAMAYAQLLQCENSQATGACGQCNACHKSKIMGHPDIHFSYPTVGAKMTSTQFVKVWREAFTENPYLDVQTWLQKISGEEKNKQGNITAEECNAIVKKLSLKVFEGKYKILLMWLPEYLGKEGNRLLKLIEEPPEQTIFLLAAENADQILNTIISRCQLVKTDRLSDEEITIGLIEKCVFDAERARQIAFLADGDFNLALQMAASPENDNANLLLDWLRKCWRGSATDLLHSTEHLAKLGRESQKQFLYYGLHFLREIMSVALAGNTALRLRESELQTAINMAKVLDFHKITAVAKIFNDNIYYIERNANAKILFLSSGIEIHKIFQSK